ncbi:fimbrial protein [Shewanella sp. MBTL60-007]|uniref:fimbrial protein n=1 Tax=Shewanella sp. MBTL60-007 TaxID=2815911 RepID=UPI001BC61EB5|nr:fimbrial protein [Shewanella sp. MBTL60-007]GIU32445.1 fimbrial protein [Shewanella sp. MBTL60-007]
MSGTVRCKYLLLIMLSLSAVNANATCVRQSWWAPGDGSPGPMGWPTSINVAAPSSPLQPTGSVIAETTAPMTQFGRAGGYDPELILYICDATDAGSLYELYATDGGVDMAGRQEDGLAYGIPGGYRTALQNTVARITHLGTGEYFSRYWKERPLTGLDTDGSGNILVKAKNFATIKAEIIKVPTGHGWYFTDAIYNYTNSFGFLVFKGPGLWTSLINAGDDSQSVYHGWYDDWPGSIALHNQGLTIRREPHCVFLTVTPSVAFASIAASTLNSGGDDTQSFNLQYRCENSYSPGVSAGEFSYAFKVGAETVAAAPSVGINVMGGSGVTHLLDNGYISNPGSAKGVGIRITDLDSTTDINLATNELIMGGGNLDGWYSAVGGAPSVSGTTTIWTRNFSATLEALPGETAEAGTVQATARVFIRIN